MISHLRRMMEACAVAAVLASCAHTAVVTTPTLQQEPPIALTGLDDAQLWERVNAQPYRISSVVDGTCIVLPPDRRNAREANPHAGAYITVFVNGAASPAMRSATSRFAEGSMIVKQKYHSTTAPSSMTDATLYTVMLKREAGFNPAAGDWEFAAFSGDGSTLEARGKLAQCMACHQERRDTDFVYRSYRHEAPSPNAGTTRN